MHPAFLTHPNVQDCCKQDENRLPHVEAGMAADVSCEKCRVCGRRHFSMTVDPLLLKGRLW